MNETANQPDDLLDLMASLTDPSRVRLLRLLERHELGVVDLCDILQMPQSTVSRHLKLLSDRGWIHSRRRGTTNQYGMQADEIDPRARALWELTRDQTLGWATARQDDLRVERRLRERNGVRSDFFDASADQWDQLREAAYGPAFADEALLALLPADLTVADLGCGTGLITARLARHVARVFAVDQSSAMLKTARQRCRDQQGVQFLEGDLEALPLDDHCCDAALLMLVLSYIDDPQPVVLEMQRILRPGGQAVVVDVLAHNRDDFRREMGQRTLGMAPDAFVRMLTDAGLTHVTARPLPPSPGATGPALCLATGAAPRKSRRNRSTRPGPEPRSVHPASTPVIVP